MIRADVIRRLVELAAGVLEMDPADTKTVTAVAKSCGVNHNRLRAGLRSERFTLDDLVAMVVAWNQAHPRARIVGEFGLDGVQLFAVDEEVADA